MKLSAGLPAAAVLVSSPSAYALRRDALGAVVRTCDLDTRVTVSPWPRLPVDRLRTVSAIGDPKRRTHVLVTPTLHITGIESPWLLSSGTPNF